MADPFTLNDSDYIQTEPWPVPKSVFIIAEVGINHNGDIDIAKQLIYNAKSSGCDAVKFQKRTIDIVYTPEMLDQFRESPWGKTQRKQKEGIELSEAEYDEIEAYCKKLEIDWFASAWDIPSQHFLSKYGLKYNKVASAMTPHREFIDVVAKEKKPTFISVGMCEYDEITHAVETFRKHDCPFILLHTVSEYPAPEANLNLRGMIDLRERYGCLVGYSGHEPSVSPSVMAAVMGAVAIERHVTLDRAMYGSDQAASLEKHGVDAMVNQVRKVAQVMGGGVHTITDKEKDIAAKLRYWL
ncbi:MAG: N-acetylneuraminate synthase family protein [Rhodospirillaceae bacterium]|nr:N-acetylneuraminate synthase family protein [Rhodospirillaceae bacterium]